MKLFKWFTFLVLSSSLGACALKFPNLPPITPEQRARNRQNWENQNCSYDTGYEQGNQDTSNGLQMNGSRVSQYCSGKLREEYMRGYRQGYAAVNGTGSTVIIVNPSR